MNLNKAFVLGNITRDIEVRSLPNGNQVASFSIATNRYYTDSAGQKKEEAEFHNIVCFGKLADISSRYLNKGSMVLIEGRIKTKNWQDTSGVKHWKTEIIAESLQMGPKNTARPFQKPEPEMPFGRSLTGEAKLEDIPIIEENYTPPPVIENNAEEQKNSFQGDAADEIDVKDIPF